MGDVLDELARSVAEEMPRRRALRLIAGAVAGVALPGWLAGGAQARRRATCITPDTLCQCPSINGLFYERCCSPDYVCSCIPPPGGAAVCSPKPCPPGRKCGSICCDVGETCADADLEYCCPVRHTPCRGGGTVTCCAPGRACCAGKCCPPGKRCFRGRCQDCPKNTRACGGRCCERGHACCDGTCCKKTEKCCSSDHCCKKDETCCGNGCCTAEQRCCGDHCCPKAKACCGKGCCAEGTTCYQLAGVNRCCPNARVMRVGGAVVCCERGDVVSGDRCCPAATPNCNACDPACLAGQYCRDGFCLQA